MATHERMPASDEVSSAEPRTPPDAPIEGIDEDLEEVVVDPGASEGEDAPDTTVPDETDESSVDDSATAVDKAPKEKKHPDESLESLEEKRRRIIEELKELRGQKRDIVGGPFKQQQDVFVDPTEDIPQQDVEYVEKILKKNGYVSKAQLEAEFQARSVKEATNDWVSKNPEFSVENDPDNIKWDRLNSYITKYFSRPVTAQDTVEILDSARERLFGKKNQQPEANPHSIAAKKEKITASARSSSGGSVDSVGSFSKKNEETSKIRRSILKDFDEEELKEFDA